MQTESSAPLILRSDFHVALFVVVVVTVIELVGRLRPEKETLLSECIYLKCVILAPTWDASVVIIINNNNNKNNNW